MAQASVARQVPAVRPSGLLDHLPVAVIEFDARGVVADLNAKAAELFGPEALGASVEHALALLHPAEGGALAEALAQANPAQVDLTLGDGRAFACDIRPGLVGGALVAMTEVSRFVQSARLATHDPLTGLLNRAGLNERLGEILARARREGTPVAVMGLDLDRFKAVNDTLGHPVGDALLVKVAQRLKSAAREGDIVARLGGDEFCILQVGGEQPAAAEALAARLVDLVGRSYVVNGHMLNVGASVGVALFPADGDDIHSLQKNADLALYRSKAEGRGVFRFFEPAMDARMQARRMLEIDLRRALALKQFELVYQPQVRFAAGEARAEQLVGFEALLRWRHLERGVVSPADFIPLSEEIGLIGPIGEWVLRTACREAASWPEPVSVAVNVSPVQFRGGKLTALVASALAQSGLEPSRLELEITEGVLLENTEATLDVLRQLKALGLRISMDDFGTGYSSLSYLQKFPFDKIKIDQSFIRGMETDGRDNTALIRAVASLGAALGMKTTAEGVETAEQLARVRAEGCQEVQGYLTGKPMSAADAAALMRR